MKKTVQADENVTALTCAAPPGAVCLKKDVSLFFVV
jgi:hypothetical protein